MIATVVLAAALCGQPSTPPPDVLAAIRDHRGSVTWSDIKTLRPYLYPCWHHPHGLQHRRGLVVSHR